MILGGCSVASPRGCVQEEHLIILVKKNVVWGLQGARRLKDGAAVRDAIKGWGCSNGVCKGWACIKGGKGMRWAVGFGGAGRASPGRSGGRSPSSSLKYPLLAQWPPHGGVAGVG